MDISPNLLFLNIHNPFRRISVYLAKHNHMSLNTKDYFVKQISHLSKGCGYSSLRVMSMDSSTIS